MQKKLTIKDGLERRFMVTNVVAGKPVQESFNLHSNMSDRDIKVAVQKGVPAEMFEPIKGFEKDYENLKKLKITYDASEKKLTNTVKCGLVNLDGSPAFAKKGKAK